MAKLANVADDLGRIKAEIAELTERKRELEDDLINSGELVIDGRLFRVTVSHYEQAKTAWRKIAEKLKASHQLIRANTAEPVEVWRVNVTSRKAA